MGKESACNAEDAGDTGLIPGLGKSPKEERGKPTPILLPGESHGQRKLEGSSPSGRKEPDMTKATEHARMRSLVFLVYNVTT